MREMYFNLNQELYYPLDSTNFLINNDLNAISKIKTNHLPTNLAAADLPNVDIKNSIVLMGISQKKAPMDVNIPIKGVFRFKKLDAFYRELSVLDIESYRQAMNYNLRDADASEKLTTQEQQLLDLETADLENLFNSSEALITSISSSGGEK